MMDPMATTARAARATAAGSSSLASSSAGAAAAASPHTRPRRRRGRAAMALLGATAAVMLAGGDAFTPPAALRRPHLPASASAASAAASAAGAASAGTRLGAERGGGMEQQAQGQLQRGGGYIGTGGEWIRQRPAAARPPGGLLMRLGASLAGGVVAERRATKGARAGAGAAAAGAEAGERDWLVEEQAGEGEAKEDGVAPLLSMDDASLSLLIPSLAGVGSGGGGGGGGGFQVHAESGYSPAVPAFLASAWSSLRGTGSNANQAEMGGMLMMDEGLVEEEEGQGPEGEEEDSVVLAAPHLLQQPPLPSVMEPSPPPPKPDFNRNDNFTVNLGRALDHLRVDVPLMFDREPDLSIFTEDIRLRDERRVYANGKFMYQMVLFSLRLAKVFMPMPPLVEVLNIRWCPQRQCIYVRFQIRVDTLSDQLYFDAVSVYKVNSQGMIYEHIIENVIRNDLVEKPSIMSLFYTTRQVLVGAPGGVAPIPDSVGM